MTQKKYQLGQSASQECNRQVRADTAYDAAINSAPPPFSQRRQSTIRVGHSAALVGNPLPVITQSENVHKPSVCKQPYITRGLV